MNLQSKTQEGTVWAMQVALGMPKRDMFKYCLLTFIWMFTHHGKVSLTEVLKVETIMKRTRPCKRRGIAGYMMGEEGTPTNLEPVFSRIVWESPTGVLTQLAYRRLKSKENFKLFAPKVVSVAYERRSLTRGSKCGDLTWKLFFFGKLVPEERWTQPEIDCIGKLRCR